MHAHLRFFLAIVLTALGLTACGAATPQNTPQATAITADLATMPTPEAPTTVPASLPTSEPTSVPSAAAAPSKDLYAVGDTAEVAPFQITVNQAASTAQLETGAPKPGHRFVLLDVTLRNRASTSQDVALLTQLFVEDQAGVTYTVDPGASLSAILTLSGEIEAGEQVAGSVGYQVPEAAQGLRLIFRTASADAASEAGRAVFDLDR